MLKRPHVFASSPQELKELFVSWEQAAYRAEQFCDWLFTQRVSQLELMSNLPLALRSRLAEHYSWELPLLRSRLDSEDGASKLLLGDANGRLYESVLIRYPGRVSLCVSSQVGCKLSCAFCQTGKLGFFRHLSTAEIMAQFVLASQIIQAEGRRITHVVFMGMGEPLDNFDAVIPAVKLLTDAYGLSQRRVTISTSGLVPQILELAQHSRAALAVSLHACRDELRSELMPINRRYPLAELKQSLLRYQELTGNLVTVEYILIQDKNCSLREARELVHFLHGLRAKVNLIPFNTHPGLPFKRPEPEQIRTFQEYLSRRGYPAPVRYSKGGEVSAACGQLAAKDQTRLNEQPLRSNVLAKESTAQ